MIPTNLSFYANAVGRHDNLTATSKTMLTPYVNSIIIYCYAYINYSVY